MSAAVLGMLSSPVGLALTATTGAQRGRSWALGGLLSGAAGAVLPVVALLVAPVAHLFVAMNPGAF